MNRTSSTLSFQMLQRTSNLIFTLCHTSVHLHVFHLRMSGLAILMTLVLYHEKDTRN